MNEIANRLNTYIQSHPFDAGDSGCETVLEQLYQAYAESHESDPVEIGDGFKELEEFLHCTPNMRSNMAYRNTMWNSAMDIGSITMRSMRTPGTFYPTAKMTRFI
jgi:hypothetical protein